MFDWNDVRCFLTVHREGTLARAGRSLGVDPTTVGRRVVALEGKVRARLFDRTPEGWRVTLAGRRLLEHASRMESEALALEREAVGADERLEGWVRLTATEMLATRFVAPRLARLRARHPQLQLELICTNRNLDLSRREADVALRLARPREENLVIKKLGDIELSLYASQSYLGSRGRPSQPDRTLAGHDLILFADSPAFASENDWVMARAEGAQVVLRSDSASSVFSALVGGMGIAVLPRIVGDAEPLLERLPTRSVPPPRQLWQSVHRDVVRNARVRVVLDFLWRSLGARRARA